MFEGIVEKTSFGAKGVVQVEDRKVTIKDALPGQTVRFSISKITDDASFVQLYDKMVTEGEDLYDGKLVR